MPLPKIRKTAKTQVTETKTESPCRPLDKDDLLPSESVTPGLTRGQSQHYPHAPKPHGGF